ncbi:MAG: hypothetical protein EA353_01415, partial [Puniceicoccaceae bacterium]
MRKNSPPPSQLLARFRSSRLATLLIAAFSVTSITAAAPVVRVSGDITLTETTSSGFELTLDKPSGRGTMVLNYAAAPLNLAEFRDLAFKVGNSGDAHLDIRVLAVNAPNEIWRDSAEGRFLIAPGSDGAMRVMLPRQQLPEDHPFRQRFGNLYGFPHGFQRHWRHIEAGAIREVRLHMQWSDAARDESIEISRPFGAGRFSVDPAVLDEFPLPLVDTFGQLRHRDWPGKVYSADELVRDGQRDMALARQVSMPEHLNRFGGWADGPKMEATGYFRVEKLNDQWWFVDPEGRLFWSLGVNSLSMGTNTPVAGREALFPSDWEGPQTRPFWNNLALKFGEEARLASHVELSLSRMIDWGLNTIGAWSMRESFEAKRVPYTLIVHTDKEGIGSISKLPDPYSSRFRESLRSSLERLAAEHAENPWLLGVFIHNELGWPGGTRLAEEILGGRPNAPARRAAIALLEETHGSISALNRAWGSNFSDFNSVRSAVRPIEEAANRAAYHSDLEAIQTMFTEAYFAYCREMMDEYFPNHLYLGGRFHNNRDYLTEAASKFVDVVSVNLYRYTLRGYSTRQVVERPYLIGEFHFGVIDHGMWGAGL